MSTITNFATCIYHLQLYPALIIHCYTALPTGPYRIRLGLPLSLTSVRSISKNRNPSRRSIIHPFSLTLSLSLSRDFLRPLKKIVFQVYLLVASGRAGKVLCGAADQTVCIKVVLNVVRRRSFIRSVHRISCKHIKLNLKSIALDWSIQKNSLSIYRS
jgi:hypothetical protein